MVCSTAYVQRANEAKGGVGFERLIVTAELAQKLDTNKFLPIIRANPEYAIPAFLGHRLYVDFTNDDSYAARLEELLRDILGMPAVPKPPLGRNPFSSELPTENQPRSVSPTGRTTAGASVLDEEWFQANRRDASGGLVGMGFKASMELRFGLHSPIAKSQSDLLTAVRKSEIHTFGWPIAVLLENRDDFRPKPLNDGIRAVVALGEQASRTGDESFDYWSLRNNGDFYLLQSLFEDKRRPNEVFFNMPAGLSRARAAIDTSSPRHRRRIPRPSS
jgi:hypothetical protein